MNWFRIVADVPIDKNISLNKLYELQAIDMEMAVKYVFSREIYLENETLKIISASNPDYELKRENIIISPNCEFDEKYIITNVFGRNKLEYYFPSLCDEDIKKIIREDFEINKFNKINLEKLESMVFKI